MRTNQHHRLRTLTVARVAAIWRAPRCALRPSSSAAKTPACGKHQYLLKLGRR